jgi:Heterokaryon incompatibility protein (HET)
MEYPNLFSFLTSFTSAAENMERIVPIVDNSRPPTKQISKIPFVYSPIDTLSDGIRLLILEPAGNLTDPITCRLQHVTFVKKPKYEALSYTWGDETVRHSISIEGRDFDVGTNLFDALRYLRHNSEERTLWIDAICINQTDIPEKNQQISLMPFIYMRAKMVRLWLGVPKDLTRAINWEELFTKKSFGVDDAERYWLDLLIDNPYWQRVWIIQEVGLAKKITVHYGTYATDWTAFIKKLQSVRELRESLPLKLQQQLDKKYEDGHKLKSLIETNRNSLCKEPRDHIYGFVGLATDCQDGFPMDYGKSLYEVWKDCIRFKNSDQPDPDDYEDPNFDLVSFGKIVQTLLGGPGIATAEEVAADIITEADTQPNASLDEADPDEEDANGELPEETKKFLVCGRKAGKIVFLGPTYEEIMSNLKAMSTWKAGINKYTYEWEQSKSREESELFLERLEDAEESDLEIIKSFDREITVPKPRKPDPLVQADIDSKGYGEPLPPHVKAASDAPRLYLLGGVSDYGNASSATVGLAPAAARVGDYVFYIHGSPKAVVVRHEEGRVILVGTAAAAENHRIARARKDGDLEDEGTGEIFESVDLEIITQPDRLDLYVDIATVYQLMG